MTMMFGGNPMKKNPSPTSEEKINQAIGVLEYLATSRCSCCAEFGIVCQIHDAIENLKCVVLDLCEVDHE
jgi:hypothetical protein